MSSTCKQSRHLRFWQLCAHCLWPARHYTTNKCSEKKTHREIIRTLLPKFCWHCIKNSLSLKNGTMWQRIHISITTYISTYITVWHKQFLAWKKILEITLFCVDRKKITPLQRGEKNVNKSKSMTDNVHVNHISHKNIFLEIQSQMCTAAHSTTVTLFRNKMFMLEKMTKQNLL